MDQNAAYRMMNEHLKDGEYSEAYDMADGLVRWIRMGGSIPTGFAHAKEVLDECAAVIYRCRQHVSL